MLSKPGLLSNPPRCATGRAKWSANADLECARPYLWRLVWVSIETVAYPHNNAGTNGPTRAPDWRTGITGRGRGEHPLPPLRYCRAAGTSIVLMRLKCYCRRITHPARVAIALFLVRFRLAYSAHHNQPCIASNLCILLFGTHSAVRRQSSGWPHR